jgi:hypothetical protein
LALGLLLNALAQAIVVYAAFEDMRGRLVDLMRSVRQASPQFLAVIGAGC